MGPGSMPSLAGQVERDEVPDQGQVEELGQIALAGGPHLDDVGHHLAEDLRHQVEPPAHLRDARRRGAG